MIINIINNVSMASIPNLWATSSRRQYWLAADTLDRPSHCNHTQWDASRCSGNLALPHCLAHHDWEPTHTTVLQTDEQHTDCWNYYSLQSTKYNLQHSAKKWKRDTQTAHALGHVSFCLAGLFYQIYSRLGHSQKWGMLIICLLCDFIKPFLAKGHFALVSKITGEGKMKTLYIR